MPQTSKAMPLLSVTVLNYNYGHFLPTCLDSILGQTFKDFELILINDKSSDNSLEVIKPYLADPRIRLVDHKENKGFVRSLIEGCDLSRGKYIAVVSADDWIVSSEAFEKQVAVMQQDSEIAYVFSGFGYYSDEQHCSSIEIQEPANFIRPGFEVFQSVIMERPMLHSSTLIRKTAYQQIGGYNPELRYAVDAQIWIDLCHAGKVAYISEELYAYRHHGDNMSANKTVVTRSIKEVLQILDRTFSMFPPEERRKLQWLYNKAIRKALATYPIGYVFKQHYGLAWYFFWVALKLRPVQTLRQKTLFILIFRTILGERGYQVLEQMKTLLNRRAHVQA